MGRRMHKRDKVAGLLLTAGKVNSFLQKAQISCLCLRRSSAFVLLFVVLLLCAHWMGSLVPACLLKQPCIGPVGWRPISWSWFDLFSNSVGCWASLQVTVVCEHCRNINASYVWKLYASDAMYDHLDGTKRPEDMSHVICMMRIYFILKLFIAWLQ